MATSCFRRSRTGSPQVDKSAIAPPASSAESRANWLSSFFLVWMFEPLAIAKQPNSGLDSFGPPSPDMEATFVFQQFQQYFDQEQGNLLRAAIRLIRVRTLLLGFVLCLLQAAFNTAVPFFTKMILEHLSGQNVLGQGELAGLCLATVFFPFFGALCQAHVLLLSRRASLKLFMSFTQAIFHKSFRKRDISVGRSISLLGNDAGVAMERSIQMLFPLFVSPIQLAVLLWLLYRELDVSVFAGIGTVIVSVPIIITLFVFIAKRHKAIMRFSDSRQKLVNEFLGAIRIIKSYAWEDALLGKINAVREQELRAIKAHAMTFNIGMGVIFLQLASILQMVVIWTYYAIGGEFSASIIFPAMQLFGLIQGPLSQLPNCVSQAILTKTALGRIGQFLNEPDFDNAGSEARNLSRTHPDEDGEVLVEFSDKATFAWRETESETRERFMLKNIECQLKSGQLVAVVSRIGGGKSSFIKAMLGEMDQVQGKYVQHGTISYASQSAFILNGTLKENILFGEKYDEDRYLQVLEVCDLLSDLERFVGGDKIVIGEKGVNLSGGQQARLSLARALYAHSDIVLADDSLAAVDTHVGNKLFDTVRACSLLKHRLMVLVTNQLFRLKHVDQIVSFNKDGEFLGCFTFDEFRQVEPEIDLEIERAEEEEAEALAREQREAAQIELDKTAKHEQLLTKRASSIHLARIAVDKFKHEEPEKLFTDEFQKRSGVEAQTLLIYLKAAGYALALIGMTIILVQMVLPSIAQIIMSKLTNAQQAVCGYVATQETCNASDTVVYLGWYTFCLGLALVLAVISGVVMAYIRMRSARNIHSLLLTTVSECSIDFFDKTPAGRISNRFAKDCASVDTQLTLFFMFTMVMACGVVASVVSVSVGTNGVYLAILVPILFCFLLLFRFQRRGGAVLHRLEGIARAPIYSLFSEVLSGRSTIRAFGKESLFIVKNEGFIRSNSVPFFYGRAGLPAFLTMYLNIIGFFSSIAVTFFVVFSGLISPGAAGLALSSVSQVVTSLYMCIFILQDFELQLNAVERVEVFVKTEALLDQEHGVVLAEGDVEIIPDKSWPSEGRISVQHLGIGYRDGQDVIPDLSLEIAPTEKIGICGRTGSAKSTLLKCFLRIMEPRRGRIVMDGIDISHVQLKTLRGRVGLIPQEPTLFYETVRYNLDPFNEHTDEAIFQALGLCGLEEFIRGTTLTYMVSEQGANFSQGQRQLLCVVRALLRQSKVLLLDEASASTDEESDRQLQQMIRVAFKHTTTLTVAHRLVSIADSDRVLVMNSGRIEEFDSPKNLLTKPGGGMFKNMVDVLEDEEKEVCLRLAGVTPEE
ncbi:hypothetical protein BASA81_006500 [Batrachochytrium salamandrivorans]|nr:hypothetical protein BASA81_006500 [Batrachochytrium salamandrivorans]